MAKLTTTPIASGYASTAALNANFDLIEAALEKTLSRDGTTPNVMEANFDMNGYHIINIAAPTLPNDPVRLRDIQDNINGAASASLVGFTPAGNIVASTVQTAIEELDLEKADLAAMTAALALKVSKTSSTGSAQLPVGTTAQEDGAIGSIRYDSTLGQFRGKGASGYALLGGGATGGGSDTVFVLNGNTINNAFTVPTGSNAHTVGPLTINALVTLNGRWVIS